MNEANDKKQETRLSVLNYAVSIAVTVGLFSLGLLMKGRLPWAGIAYPICSAMLLLSALIGGIGGKIYAENVKKRSVSQMNDITDDKRSRIARDPMAEWRKLRLLCTLTWVYVATLWLLCLGTAFFYGVSGSRPGGMLPYLFSLFFLTGLMGRLIQPRTKQDHSHALPEDKFPKLYALAREVAAGELGRKKLYIHVIHGIPDHECNAALSLTDDSITIHIGAVLLCVLDEAELKQVILHEIAHTRPEDVSQNRFYNRVMGYITANSHSILGAPVEFALTLAIGHLYHEGQFFFLFSSREKEQIADHLAANCGNLEKQASALAKIHAHDLFVFEQEPYVNLFIPETVPQHLMTDRARAFRNALTERSNDWRRILENEIPSRVATHPTFRQRWEALGCCTYSLMPAETESEFLRECWAAAEVADAERAALPQEQYDKMRQENYLDYLKMIADFEASDGSLSPDAMRDPILAYYRTGKPEKAEELCDKLIADLESPFATAFARYWKGVLMLYRYDKAGLDYIYQAMELNTNYIDDGLNKIGSYCTQMGLQKELDEYRNRAPEFMQLKKDRAYDGITDRAKLAQAVLPDGWLEQIRDFILQCADGTVEKIYLVKELVSEDYTPSAFVLRFREGTADSAIDDVYERVFRLLDDWPEDYDFSLYVYEKKMEKALKHVANSCIYSGEGA